MKEPTKLPVGSKLRCRICGTVFLPEKDHMTVLDECKCGAVYMYKRDVRVFSIEVITLNGAPYDTVVEVIPPGASLTEQSDDEYEDYLLSWGGCG